MTEEQEVKREILITLRNGGLGCDKKYIYSQVYCICEKCPSWLKFEEIFQQMVEKGLIRRTGEKGFSLTLSGKDALEIIKKENTVTFKEALVNLLTGKWKKIKSNC